MKRTELNEGRGCGLTEAIGAARLPRPSFAFSFQYFIHLIMRKTEREREAQAEGAAGSVQGAQGGTRSRDPGPWPGPHAGAPRLSPPGPPQLLFPKQMQKGSN